MEGSHEAIITKELYMMVQEEMVRRANLESIMAFDFLQHLPERTSMIVNVKGIPAVMPVGDFEGSAMGKLL